MTFYKLILVQAHNLKLIRKVGVALTLVSYYAKWLYYVYYYSSLNGLNFCGLHHKRQSWQLILKVIYFGCKISHTWNMWSVYLSPDNTVFLAWPINIGKESNLQLDLTSCTSAKCSIIYILVQVGPPLKYVDWIFTRNVAPALYVGTN